MTSTEADCIVCRGAEADTELHRVQVWENDLWRLTLSLDAEVLGLGYLEPKRHIADFTALDGAEARTLGPVLARVTRVLKEETGADLVYVYVFGDDIRHLHIHLAPHVPGDALSTQMIRGEIVEERLESGAVRYVSEDFPPLPREDQLAVTRRVEQRLAEH
jgi:diadenosine tetraphosphate (Ap4A) HIT family hydrolase